MTDDQALPGLTSEDPRVQMALDDYESSLRLLMDLGGLVAAHHLTLETRLHAVAEAVTRAIGGNMEDARDFVQHVLLGTISDV